MLGAIWRLGVLKSSGHSVPGQLEGGMQDAEAEVAQLLADGQALQDATNKPVHRDLMDELQAALVSAPNNRRARRR